MSRRRQLVESFQGHGIELGAGPFDISDREALVEAVEPLRLSAEELAKAFAEMNRAWRKWAYERIAEIEPTEPHQIKWLRSPFNKASGLADL